MNYKGVEIKRAGYTATVGCMSARFSKLEDLMKWIDREVYKQQYVSAIKERRNVKLLGV